MRKRPLVLVMLALTCNPLVMAYAHDHHHDHDRDRDRWERHDYPGPRWHDHRGWRDHDRDHHSRYAERDFYYGGHHFRPGGRYPHRYYQDRYWVNDWHRHGLGPPPHGQRWANINGNYVLIAVATGVITSLILNN
ncbi:RcnB family protein [Rosenbergiella collisarenosi]|uniref:RcnB family protein n=1 Tax=Rosenbergiella collisarenosi TaxID=1544695 RepID=UPI001F4FAD06|nr:RcnB family protein [Rosenbergiella collisarenosi]